MCGAQTILGKVGISRLVDPKKFILAGDLNLTLSTGEIWGDASSLGLLASFFNNYFHKNMLIDIVPRKVVPTWRNGRTRAYLIAKRLDISFLSEDLIASVGIYRAWVEFPFISDHAPILLQLDLPPLYKAFPYKFNPLWIKEQCFISMVQKLWNDPLYMQETGKQIRFVWKLKYLKAITKVWQKD